jgi:hypothetical protein
MKAQKELKMKSVSIVNCEIVQLLGGFFSYFNGFIVFKIKLNITFYAHRQYPPDLDMLKGYFLGLTNK